VQSLLVADHSRLACFCHNHCQAQETAESAGVNREDVLML
jgi:hypothetical protein